jgi:hypothetical protein
VHIGQNAIIEAAQIGSGVEIGDDCIIVSFHLSPVQSFPVQSHLVVIASRHLLRKTDRYNIVSSL